MLITISGPAGTGKSIIAKELSKTYHYPFVVLCTTRERRPDEKQDIDYHFLTVQNFKNLDATGQLINVEEYPGNRFYGINKKDIQQALLSPDPYILVCTPRGIREIEQNFHTFPTYKIYVTTPLHIRAKRYIERLKDKFSLNDLNELVNRSNMDYGKFDGFEKEVDLILDNSKELSEIEMKDFIQQIQERIAHDLDLNILEVEKEI